MEVTLCPLSPPSRDFSGQVRGGVPKARHGCNLRTPAEPAASVESSRSSGRQNEENGARLGFSLGFRGLGILVSGFRV